MTKVFRLIQENSLHALENGYEFQIRLNWYRSLPFSCIETLKLAVNEEEVSPENIGFRINDRVYSKHELYDLIEEFWFVQDPATIVVNLPEKVVPGKEYTLKASISIRAPYIPTGPNQYLTITTVDSLTQVAN